MKAFYVAGTHWDREWYEPFQGFRMWLVDLIDHAMDLLEKDPSYACFHLDGQAVVLEDYLEIRPERRERLVKLLKEKRLIAGPWYDLPDEWLISAESYLRNLSRGMRICREMGFEPMRFAYTPDQFGHIVALPMIMSGMGLKAGICWRGTQDESHPALFNWVGPDGSRMATFKLCDDGSYAPFLMFVRQHLRAKGHGDEVYAEHFTPYIEKEKARSPIPLTLMIDAIDHDRPDPAMPGILDELRAKYPDITFQWGSLSEFADEVLKYQDQLPEFEGELRWPARDVQRVFQCLIPHTTSSRYPLKQRNSQCQALLEKWAEPFALLQQMAGGEPILKYLDKAWEYLLRNHPHDSICGCSIDQVHRDMMYRFDQAEMLGDITTKRAMVHLGALNDSDAALRNVVIHNPLPFRRRGVMSFPLHFAKGWPQAHRDVLSSAEMVNRFHLVTKSGERVPYQVARIDRDVTAKRLCPDNRESARVQDIYEIVAELDLPPCGYTALHVEETGDANRPPKGMYKGGLSAENEHLAVTFRSDGSASLKDKASGLSLDNLFLYEDTGDSGDGWSYGRLSSDIAVLSPGTRCTTAVTEVGPLRTVFRVERELDLPAALDIVSNKRDERRETLRIVDHVAIEKGAPFLRVHTEVWNSCEDHRLRVLFPTHLNASVSFAESPFAVVERAIEVPDEARVWHERVCPEKPFTTFCGVQDGARGLAVLAPFGPHEYEVMDTDDRALAITLFRSTHKTVSTSGEPDGQLLGKMTFDYLLYPFAGGFDAAKASRFVAEAQAGVRTHGAAEMPEDCWRFEAISTAAIVTALKPADDGQGGIVRFWNPTTQAVQQEFRANPRVTTAWSCTLNEENGQSLNIAPDGSVAVEVPARGLATVRFGWK